MEKDLVYDVGMHNGDDTAYYLFKGYRVVAIEADPELAAAARLRFGTEIDAGRLTVLNLAIGPRDGVARFWISERKRVWNSLDRNVASRNGLPCHSIEVPCRRLVGVLAEHGVPYYLKIDIEGADRHCLEDLEADDLPRYLSFEASSLDDLIAARAAGYDRFQCVNQVDFRPLRFTPIRLSSLLVSRLHRFPRLLPAFALPWRARNKLLRVWARLRGEPSGHGLARDAGWSFPPGSSGPFGEGLGGRWQTFEEVVFSWLAYRLGQTSFGEASLRVWHDIHATRSEQL